MPWIGSFSSTSSSCLTVRTCFSTGDSRLSMSVSVFAKAWEAVATSEVPKGAVASRLRLLRTGMCGAGPGTQVRGTSLARSLACWLKTDSAFFLAAPLPVLAWKQLLELDMEGACAGTEGNKQQASNRRMRRPCRSAVPQRGAPCMPPLDGREPGPSGSSVGSRAGGFRSRPDAMSSRGHPSPDLLSPIAPLLAAAKPLG
mmetsp:Transcript_118485/g.347064  ORF Transcript_118485/g.347064 Transcript_118485/m.347064 type:complete len:200 (+) Transcript_118485:1369-1968(+)